HGAQPDEAPQDGDRDRGARPALRAERPGQRVGSPLQGRAYRPLHLRRLQRDRRPGAVRPPHGPVRAAQPCRQSRLRERQGAAGGGADEARPLQGTVLQRKAVRLACAAAAIALASASTAVASAKVGHISGLHDARYCEIIELKGVPPTASATVWNTVGLNKCPEAQWRAFDAGALARELGDTLVVLNGPRHFLMDSASAVAGGVRSFHGLRARKAATIPIRSVADLVQAPYTDRTLRRTSTWRGKEGRTASDL